MKHPFLPYYLFFVVAVLGTLPLFQHGFWPFGYDADCHCKWFFHFSRQFWNGEFYPRWLNGMNGGLGSPTFFYYPPMPYWITSFLRPLVPGDPQGWFCLAISCALALFVSASAAYQYLKGLTGRSAAVAGAIIYQILPYHLSIDLYTRSGAFSEFWSFAWLPWIVLFTHRVTIATIQPRTQNDSLLRKPSLPSTSISLAGLAASYGALAMTNLPTVLTFSWIPVAYSSLLAFFMLQEKAGPSKLNFLANKAWWRAILLPFAGLVLGVGLASIYVIPALGMQHVVCMEGMTQGNQYYENHFLGLSTIGTNPWLGRLYLLVGSSIFAGVVASLTVWLCYGRGRIAEAEGLEPDMERTTRLWLLAKVWTLIMLCACFMMLPLSKPIYLAFPKLQMIQFPWRFSAGASLCVAILLSVAVETLLRRQLVNALTPGVRRRTFLAFLLYAFGVFWIYTVIDASYELWTRQPPESVDLRYPEVNEYRTQWATTNWQSTLSDLGIESASSVKGILTETQKPLQSIVTKGRHIVFQIDSPRQANIQVNQFDYPGWVARVEGSQLKALPPGTNGLLNFSIPPGQYKLSIDLAESAYERAAQILFLISSIIWIALVIFGLATSSVKSAA